MQKEQEEKQDLQSQDTQETQDLQEDLQAQLKEAQDKYIRVHADFENIKKRLEKEKFQAVEYANEIFARDLLEVVDSLDMALAIDDEASFLQLKEGLELTKTNLLKTFQKHGVKEIETNGGFDPNFHEAIMQVDSEKPKNEIVNTLKKGYICKERIIRPAMVSISKGQNNE